MNGKDLIPRVVRYRTTLRWIIDRLWGISLRDRLPDSGSGHLAVTPQAHPYSPPTRLWEAADQLRANSGLTSHNTPSLSWGSSFCGLPRLVLLRSDRGLKSHLLPRNAERGARNPQRPGARARTNYRGQRGGDSGGVRMATAAWKSRRLDELGFVDRGKSRHRPRNEATLYGGSYPFIQTADIMAADPYITSYSQTYSEFGLQQSKVCRPIRCA